MKARCCAECIYRALPDDVSWECRLNNVEFRAPQYNMYTHCCDRGRSPSMNGEAKMKVKLDEGAILPERAHPEDAGLDLRTIKGGCVRAGQSMTFRTGVHVQLPKGTAGLLLPKSGLMLRDLLTFGVVDEGYTGEIMVHMFNLGNSDYSVQPKDKVSQMVVVRIVRQDVEEVDELPEDSERGNAGFGSTGR